MTTGKVVCPMGHHLDPDELENFCKMFEWCDKEL
jgi:hypothetical protein